ncbi:MAG: inositol monophosphatase family protein [Dehalococcoidia bacterium]|nr:inositol monophosphatase family protein [Dehalococcoidia bacterium]
MISQDKISDISKHLLSIMTDVDQKSSTFFKNYHSLDIETKKDNSLVTNADKEIEAFIVDKLLSYNNTYNIIGEEQGAQINNSEFSWIIDPIDATNNFIRGIPIWATLISCMYKNECIASIVSAPAMQMQWYATKNSGAFQIAGNNQIKRLRVSSKSSLAESQVLYGSLDLAMNAWGKDNFLNVLDRSSRSRGFGDFYGHCLIGEGAAEIMLDADLKIWDVAPFLLLIPESGGVIEYTGNLTANGVGEAISANSIGLKEEVVSLLRTI